MNAPALRFKDDDGRDFPEWEDKLLGSIVNFQNGKGHENIIEENGKYIVINSKFIASNGKTFKCAETALTPITKDTNVMVMSDVPNGKALGKCFFVAENNKYTLNQRICSLRSDESNNKFLFYLINRNSHFLSFDGGVGQTNLKKEDVLSCPLTIPKSKKEQTKIANFLTAVDEKITQLTQKHDLLTQYKKGVMQQIFSQELRFKDDDGQDFPEWEEKLLGQLCSITTGKLDANAMVEDGQYRFYTCAREYYQIDKYAFDTEALLISGNGANVGYIHYYKGKFNAYQRTYVLDNFEQNIIFVKYFLDEFLHVRIFKEAKEGNTPYIVMGTLTDMEIKIPPLPEQTKIANFLTAIDDKITNTQTQLQAVKQYKQGLLQQMFV